MRAGLKTDFFVPPGPRLIAHRGLCPAGNHAGSLHRGLSRRNPLFRLDVHASRDGVLVVCCMTPMRRTTDLSDAIRELYYAEIARADAGYRFEVEGRFPFRGAGVRVPRLIDVLGLFSDAFFVIEIKQVEPA